MRISLFLVGVLLACSSTPDRTDKPVQMKPATPVDFAEGVDLTPAATLLAWLEDSANAPPRKIRLPVVVRLSVLGVESATVGIAEDKSGLVLKLDDGALGVGLADTLRSRCPGAPTCAVWVEGQWGELVPMPAFDDDGPPTFSVMRIGKLVAAGDAAKAYAQKR